MRPCEKPVRLAGIVASKMAVILAVVAERITVWANEYLRFFTAVTYSSLRT